MAKDMKVNIKMIVQKEKEFITGMTVINMMANLKMVKEKEKGYFIIIMVIEKWEII